MRGNPTDQSPFVVCKVHFNQDFTYKILSSLPLVRTLIHMTEQQLLDLHETVEACSPAGGSPRMCRDNAW